MKNGPHFSCQHPASVLSPMSRWVGHGHCSLGSMFARAFLVVPANNVAFIVPRAERLWLASPVQIIESRQARS